mgnify:CR=1 FL=1|tara:strand:- start:13 stop:459 length:447 start_codon:yes stop_codon:yes gene_type:complete
MSQRLYQVPEETARVARAIYPDGNLVMQVYDELTMLFDDRDFADLFPIQGQPAESPAKLALVTLLQFMEGLTDRQAADAVRTRIDWKYLLCMELTDAGFHHTVLSEFRTRLLTHEAERCAIRSMHSRRMLPNGSARIRLLNVVVVDVW